MKKYLNKEVLTPAVTLVFLTAYILEALKLAAPMIDGVPQETFFPVIIFIFGSIGAIALLIPAIKKTSSKDYVQEKKGPVNRKPLYIVLATAFLLFFFDILGYMIVAPIYLFLLMMIYDDKPQQIVRKIIYSVLITVFVFVLYTYVFDISFPQFWR